MDINQYAPMQLSYKELKTEVEIPKFQRGLVWGNQQKESFIETLSKGYPFGSFLLFKDISKAKYQLIDGLQRYTTVGDYEANRYNYIRFKSLFERELTDLFNLIITDTSITNISKKNIADITNRITNYFANNINEKSPASKIGDMLFEYEDLFKNLRDSVKSKIREIIEEMVSKSLEYIPLDKLQFPAVIYKGNPSDLPDVYERINATGTQLSKFEIYAAIWSNANLKVDDKELLTIVENRYINIINSSELTVSGYEQGSILSSKYINLFEYVYAVGVMIIKTAPCISSGKTPLPDSLGCLVTAGCLKIPTTDIDNLYPAIKKLDTIKLKNKIIDATKAVNDILQKFITMGATKVKTNFIFKFTEQQIAAMICTAFEIRNIVNSSVISERSHSGKSWARFGKYLPYHYLYDVLNDTWTRRHGNKHLDEIIGENINSKRYISYISEDFWSKFFDAWIEDQMNKSSEKIGADQRLFLNYLRVLTNNSPDNLALEVTPIISVKTLQSKFGKGCYAALGNLTIISTPEKRNVPDKSNIMIRLDNDQKELYRPERSELLFVNNADTFTMENYMKFLKDRHNFLINNFLRLVRTNL